MGWLLRRRRSRALSQPEVTRQAAHWPDRSLPRLLRTAQRTGSAQQSPDLAHRGVGRMSGLCRACGHGLKGTEAKTAPCAREIFTPQTPQTPQTAGQRLETLAG